MNFIKLYLLIISFSFFTGCVEVLKVNDKSKLTQKKYSFSYPATNSFVKNTSTINLIPNKSSDDLKDFTIQPVLPSGVSIDNSSGIIQGTSTQSITETIFTVSASTPDGKIITATVDITIVDGISAPTISFTSATGNTINFGSSMTVNPTTLASNGADINNCVISPALPDGLTINTSTCVISGTPTSTLSTTTYTINATNSAGTSTDANVSLTVNAIAPTITFLGAAGTNGSFGNNMSITPTSLLNNGSSISSCTIFPNLPLGLTINNSTCVISGTPTESFSPTSLLVSVSNSIGTTTTTVSISVAATPPSISYSGSTGTIGNFGSFMTIIPSTLASNGASISGCNIKSGTTSLPNWASINSSTCVISGTPTSILNNTTFTIQATNSAGSSADASVDLSASAIAPTLSYSGSSGTIGAYGSLMNIIPTNLASNGAPITNCTIKPGTTSLPTWLNLNSSTCVLSGTPNSLLAATTFTINAANSAGNSSDATVIISATASIPTLSYLGTSGTTVAIGSSLIVKPTTRNSKGSKITACGIKQGTTALPAWASIDTNTCIITGSPTTVSSATYTIVATNEIGDSADASVTLTTSASAPTLTYQTANEKRGKKSVAMTINPTLATNGSTITSCTATPLPGGMTINNSTCVISGTPTAEFVDTKLTVTVTNSIGSNTAYVNLYACPTNFIPVPMNSAVKTTTDFCVAKYEMKNVSSVATSQAASTPYVNLTWSASKAKCEALGGNYKMISNAEWMTLARNIEAQSSNWSSGSVNNGVLARGHSDNSPTSPQAAAADNSPYSNTGNAATDAANAGWEQKRTHNISTGDVIWDLAGNAEEWIDWSVTDDQKAYRSIDSRPVATNIEFNVLDTLISANDYMPTSFWSPLNLTLDSTNNGIGAYYAGVNNSSNLYTGIINYPARGGNNSDSSQSGVYRLRSSYISTDTSSSRGFRCTYRFATLAPIITYSTNSYLVRINNNSAINNPINSGGSISSCSINPALPTGLTFNTTTCAITGTPTAVSSATTYTITASNTAGNSTTTLNLEVADRAPNITYSNTSYIFTVERSETTGNPTSSEGVISTCSINRNLPEGLNLNTQTCAISGIPTTETSTNSYTITPTSSVGDGEAKSITITVVPETSTPVIESDYTWDFANRGNTIDYQPIITVTAATSCRIIPSDLGVSVSSNCRITSPGIFGNTVFTIIPSNKNGDGNSMTFTVGDFGI